MDINLTFCCMLLAYLMLVQAAQSEGPDISVTLIGGRVFNEGTIEYSNDGNGNTRHTICGQDSNISAVKVVCRQLGFPGANKYFPSSPFERSSQVPSSAFFKCTGNEEKLCNCSIQQSCSSNIPDMPAAAVCYNGPYLGCFVDDQNHGVLPASSLASNNQTIEKCLRHCEQTLEYVYAGVENGSECYCGNVDADYDRLGRVGDEECQSQCSGDVYRSCGGPDRIAVFQIRIPTTQGTSLPSPLSSSSPSPSSATTRRETSTTTTTTTTTATTTTTRAARTRSTRTVTTRATTGTSTSTRASIKARTGEHETSTILTVLYAGIGGGGAFLVILIIIIVIACFCCKQRNMKNTPPDQADDPSVMYALPDRQVRTLNLRSGKPSSYEDNLNVYAISSIDGLEPIVMKTSKDERELYTLPNNNQHSHEIKNGSGTRIDVEGTYALPDKYRMGNDIGNTIMVENDLYCST